IRVMFPQPYQCRFIYRGENPSRAYRMRPAASVLPQTFRRVARKEFLKFSRKSHGETMQKRGALLKERRFWPSLFDVYSNQTRRAFPGHESACPAIAGIKKLLVTPKHLQLRTRRFLPSNFLIDVSFPRRRLTGHQVHIKRCRPIENAVTRNNESLIARRRRGNETLGSIVGSGR